MVAAPNREIQMNLAIHIVSFAVVSAGFASFALAAPGGKQELDFGKGNSVPFAALAEEPKAPMSFVSEDAFKLRLKNGGTVSVSQSDLVLGAPEFRKRGLFVLGMDVLELKKGARIVTGGNDLVIYTNKVISEGGEIISFDDKSKKAANAMSAGGAGSPGVSGGTVSIFAVNGIEGRLSINLRGQEGGDGAQGNRGADGQMGMQGYGAQTFLGVCQSPGTSGAPGSPGQRGATGGPTGHGGSGGTFILYNVGATPIPGASWEFSAAAGDPGKPGDGGPGGNGGAGGLGGSGYGLCRNGPRGAWGSNGQPGDAGSPGLSGAPGNYFVRNLDFESLLKTGKSLQSAKVN